MPLVKNEAGEPITAECLNKCGQLARLDRELSLVGPEGSGPTGNAELTVLVCPVCQYCELYYGVS
jgi:hypothetical protein